MKTQYHLAALGGTFDHLHAGHQQLITSAVHAADHCLVGVVKDATLSQKQFLGSLQTYAQRLHAFQNFLRSKRWQKRVTLVPLIDIYGPTITDTNIDLLVVTPETLPGAHQVNKKRTQIGMPKIPIHTVPLVTDDSGQTLSSTRIRSGLADRRGHAYLTDFSQKLILLPRHRSRLQSVHSQLMQLSDIPDAIKAVNPSVIVLVGDQVTRSWHQANWLFHYAIVDGKIQRQSVGIPDHHYNHDRLLKVDNPAGSISNQAARLITQLFSQPKGLLTVTGEEDLLAFPAVLLAPLNALVCYGQPHQGVVVTQVTEATKAATLSLMCEVFASQ